MNQNRLQPSRLTTYYTKSQYTKALTLAVDVFGERARSARRARNAGAEEAAASWQQMQQIMDQIRWSVETGEYEGGAEGGAA